VAADHDRLTCVDEIVAAVRFWGIDGGIISVDAGLTLFTVTVLADDTAMFPELSRATAVSVWTPLTELAVFHDVEYGEAVASVPRFRPSSLNCTPDTATLSEAMAEMVTVPEIVAPSAGLLSETEGSVVSAGDGAAALAVA